MRQALCPICGAKAERALHGVFPVWLCQAEEHDAPVLFGVWAEISTILADWIPGEGFAFLVVENPRHGWYWRGLWATLTGRLSE